MDQKDIHGKAVRRGGITRDFLDRVRKITDADLTKEAASNEKTGI